MSLLTTEYPAGINEFLKSGLTQIQSDIFKPYRVAQRAFRFECKVNETFASGNECGAGNLIIYKVVKIHMNETILNANGYVKPEKIDLVSRIGSNWYSRAKTGLFEVEKSLQT